MRNSVDIIHFHSIGCTHARTHAPINCCRCADLSVSSAVFEQHRLAISFFCCANAFIFSLFARPMGTMRCNLMHLCADFKMFKRITQQKRITNYAFDVEWVSERAHAHPPKFNICSSTMKLRCFVVTRHRKQWVPHIKTIQWCVK